MTAPRDDRRQGDCSDPEHPNGAYCVNTTGLATCYPPEMTAPRDDRRQALADRREWRFGLFDGRTLVVMEAYGDDPGDRGEPRSWSEDDIEYLVVNDGPDEAATAPPTTREALEPAGLDVERLANVLTTLDPREPFDDWQLMHVPYGTDYATSRREWAAAIAVEYARDTSPDGEVEHVTDGSSCWCQPTAEMDSNGDHIFVHREVKQ